MAKVELDNLPSNSHKSKQESPKREVKKVVTGKVTKKKKSLGKKFSEVFIGEDIDNVGQYLFYDVLIPAAKATITDMVSVGIEKLLYGESRRSDNIRRDRGKTHVSYQSFHKKPSNKLLPSQRHRSNASRARRTFDDISFESRRDAEDVLSGLVTLVDEYGMASVADMYNMVDVTSDWTDNKYGWTNLSTATVSRGRDGYYIDMPRPVELD